MSSEKQKLSKLAGRRAKRLRGSSPEGHVSATMPQHQKQKQLSFGKADTAFNTPTAGVRGYIIYFPKNMNAIQDFLGTSEFCMYFGF